MNILVRNSDDVLTGVYRNSQEAALHLTSGHTQHDDVTVEMDIEPDAYTYTTADGFEKIAAVDRSVEVAANAALDQFDQWAMGLSVYDNPIPTRGKAFINACRQAIKEIYEDTTKANSLKVKIFNNLALGATDITSSQAFAKAIDNFSGNPTHKISWVSTTTGERVALVSAEALSLLDATFKPYDRSWLEV